MPIPSEVYRSLASSWMKPPTSSRKLGRWFCAPHYLIRVDPPWFITTPAGLNWFHDLWEAAEDQPDWSTHSYTTIQGGNVPAEEIEAARRTLDERTFKQEYLASFETLTGRVYPDFDDDNIREDIGDTGSDILLGCDFNVGVMAWRLGESCR